jgi:hypothetical protein
LLPPLELELELVPELIPLSDEVPVVDDDVPDVEVDVPDVSLPVSLLVDVLDPLDPRVLPDLLDAAAAVWVTPTTSPTVSTIPAAVTPAPA